MEHYVTLFDSLFLPQGLALHTSMERHLEDYTLWVLCVDDQAHDVLIKLNLNNVQLLQLSKLETTELLRIKSTRSKGEYCWTLTPFAPRFVFEADSTLKRVTYIDADIWFRKNPASLLRELENSGKQVLITDHAYAPEYDQSSTSGQFCVQFMTFTREGCEPVRKWWEDRCLEWCYARPEDGKYGDQKYLDDWPERFNGLVHVVNDTSLTLAPWNAIRFPYSASIFYHFHGLRLTKNKIVMFEGYVIPKPTYKNIYLPYLRDFRGALKLLCKIGIQRPIQANNVGRFVIILSYLRIIFSKITNGVTYKTSKIGS
jgi:hypothetical protein